MADIQDASAGFADQSELGNDNPSQKNMRETRLNHFGACATCRKRKSRCDGREPVCSTCARAGRQCLYLDIRKGTRKKRTSIKILEARLAELESRERTQDPGAESATGGGLAQNFGVETAATNAFLQDLENHARPDSWFQPISTEPPIPADPELRTSLQHNANPSDISHGWEETQNFDISTMTPARSNQDSENSGLDNESILAMLSLGHEEPLPPQEVQDDLFQIFFDKVHPHLPAIHQARFLLGMSLPTTSRLRPPLCLCYVMWALASAVSEPYNSFHDYFYRRARKYAEVDELKGRGEAILTVWHAQAWFLIGSYETRLSYSSRGYLSCRKACALTIALGLHKLDGVGLYSIQLHAPSSDWIELEQRRRTFWMIFVQDRFYNVASGFPMAIDERDVKTHLPASDDSFIHGTPGHNMTLKEAMLPTGARNLSYFATIAVLATLFGRIMTELHRPDPSEGLIDDLESKFWHSFRDIDNTLVNILSSFKASSATGSETSNSSGVFLKICMRACMICLHQAALFKAGSLPRLSQQATRSRITCMKYAQEIVHTMKGVNDAVALKMGPFAPFCLYMAMRVFVLALKEGPSEESETLRADLQYLVTKMKILSRVMTFTEHLLSQLEMESNAVDGLNPTGHVTTLPPANETKSDDMPPTENMNESNEDWSGVGKRHADMPKATEEFHQPLSWRHSAPVDESFLGDVQVDAFRLSSIDSISTPFASEGSGNHDSFLTTQYGLPTDEWTDLPSNWDKFGQGTYTSIRTGVGPDLC